LFARRSVAQHAAVAADAVAARLGPTHSRATRAHARAALRAMEMDAPRQQQYDEAVADLGLREHDGESVANDVDDASFALFNTEYSFDCYDDSWEFKENKGNPGSLRAREWSETWLKRQEWAEERD
jgi:hypothetical protein